ncbi:MAG: hypothetical protein F4Z23_06175, partial [Acidimicrobiaceae bacterium]|nr:hypothetical protein [Acidimicrobiaceae bacterium]MYE97468.1 hypothetical protein [Acidimicrobiaceae bacterium]
MLQPVRDPRVDSAGIRHLANQGFRSDRPSQRHRMLSAMKYASPTTVAEAVDLLGYEPDARVYAGATDLIPQIRAGRPEPTVMVDLKRIERLCAISGNGSNYTVGAATPTADICAHAGLTAAFPGLVEASGLIGSDQIQSRSS